MTTTQFTRALLTFAAASTLQAQLLYVANNGERSLSSFIYDQGNGNLSEILPRVATPGSPTSVAITPNGQFALVTTAGPPTLTTYSIDQTSGALTQTSSSPLPNGSGPQKVAIDASGKFAVIAHPGVPTMSVFSIEPGTGATTPLSGSPFATPPQPASVVIHPSGFIYVGANGAPAQGTPSQIAGYNLSDLSPIAGSPFPGKNNVQAMVIDPAGKFLYVVERQDPGILAFAIDDKTGALTPVPGSPFTIPNSFLTGIAVDPAGKFLYTSNGGGVIRIHSIGDNGALTDRGFAPSLTGSASVIFDPNGKFLYVPAGATVPTIQGSDTIATFSVDSSTGALTAVPSLTPTGANPLRGAAVVLATPVIAPIQIREVTNSLSRAPRGMPSGNVAQGSQMMVKGKNIGPSSPVPAQGPLAGDLAGVSIAISSGGATIPCLVYFASSDEADCVVPSSTPLGEATVTLTYNGRTTAAAPITIVTTSVGLRTRNESGNGPSASWNVPSDVPFRLDASILQIPNSLSQSAKPGQIMVIQGTGLGPVSADETSPDLITPLTVQPDVLVAGKTASLLAAVRAPSGSDFIVFKLPDDTPTGCYVPVMVRSGGIVSNAASISVATNGGSCSDPHGFTASDIDAAQRTGALAIGTVYLGHIGFGDEAHGRFVSYNTADLAKSFAPASFDGGISGAFAVPPLGSCTVTPGSPTTSRDFDIPPDQTPLQRLNAGARLNLTGPKGSIPLNAPSYSFEAPDSNTFTPGDYGVDNGSGTPAVGSFKGAITLPTPIKWTNQDSITAIDRTQDLTINWTGGAADKEYVFVGGLSQNNSATSAFLCVEKVTAGKLTVPSWVLSTLPVSGVLNGGGGFLPGGAVVVGTSPLTSTGRFTATGLNFATFTYEQGSFTLAPFR